ncbi:MAG: hypothetical protein KDD58_14795 [Bdellovibrionales bacterium]|nr:hypothetical protein [Bdellovibrionales bacterium]
MKEVIIFNDHSSLNFHEIRDNIIRIPEVSMRIREAQSVWDALGESDFSFYNFLMAEDQTFLSNIKTKNLVSSIVQIGLYDRYVRQFGRPEYVIGTTNGDSPLHVCLGLTHFEDMILDSQVARPVIPIPILNNNQTFLTGVSLAETGVFKHNSETGKYVRIEEEKNDISKIISYLIEDCQVKKLVNIGPGSSSLEPLQPDLLLKDIQIVESIDTDPMLSWFWTEMRKVTEQLSMAQ